MILRCFLFFFDVYDAGESATQHVMKAGEEDDGLIGYAARMPSEMKCCKRRLDIIYCSFKEMWIFWHVY